MKIFALFFLALSLTLHARVNDWATPPSSIDTMGGDLGEAIGKLMESSSSPFVVGTQFGAMPSNWSKDEQFVWSAAIAIVASSGQLPQGTADELLSHYVVPTLALLANNPDWANKGGAESPAYNMTHILGLIGNSDPTSFLFQGSNAANILTMMQQGLPSIITTIEGEKNKIAKSGNSQAVIDSTAYASALFNIASQTSSSSAAALSFAEKKLIPQMTEKLSPGQQVDFYSQIYSSQSPVSKSVQDFIDSFPQKVLLGAVQGVSLTPALQALVGSTTSPYYTLLTSNLSDMNNGQQGMGLSQDQLKTAWQGVITTATPDQLNQFFLSQTGDPLSLVPSFLAAAASSPPALSLEAQQAIVKLGIASASSDVLSNTITFAKKSHMSNILNTFLSDANNLVQTSGSTLPNNFFKEMQKLNGGNPLDLQKYPLLASLQLKAKPSGIQPPQSELKTVLP